VIFGLDTVFVCFSFFLAYSLRFNFEDTSFAQHPFYEFLATTGVVYIIGFLIIKPYAGILRHTGIVDLERIIFANLLSFGISLSFYFLSIIFDIFPFARIPLSIVIINFFVLTFLMTSVRFTIKSFYRVITRNLKKPIGVIIYGAGNEGLKAKEVIEHDPSFNYKVVGFIDDKGSKSGKVIDGIPIFSSKKISQQFISSLDAEIMILAIQKMQQNHKRRLLNKFIEFDIQMKVVPPVEKWINGEFASNQLEDIEIEDLLERDPIRLDHKEVKEKIKDKVVMVTGGAGSIGSEIVRQLMYYKPEKLILLDKAESALHDLYIELEQTFFNEAVNKVKIVLCDVRNYSRLESVFQRYRPEVIYHAAAYKHVPMMEVHPYEAIKTNVFGTRNVLNLSVKYSASHFVLVSTDKAVNPTNVMGASKRLAEVYCQSYQNNSDTTIITTRFGNVLGSNGSVIPLFKKQIKKGGPITVTHPDVTRFFMTIPEASELVLEAGAMGKGGEIFVFDMGKSIKVVDLAKKMLQICGKSEKDVPIEFVGLRPGEKLYEELLSNYEQTTETYHPKIRIAKGKSLPTSEIKSKIELLISRVEELTDIEIVRLMKSILPEYKSNNSVFESLDKEKEALVS